MSESRERWIAFSKLVAVVIFAFLYALGGEQLGDTGHKWIRRYVASAFMAICLFVYTRDWRVFLQYPLTIATLSLGYGIGKYGENVTVWLKIIRRGIWGLANGISFNLYTVFDKKVAPIVWGSVIAVSASIGLGVYNFTPSARMEEMAIGALIAIIPISTAREKVHG